MFEAPWALLSAMIKPTKRTPPLATQTTANPNAIDGSRTPKEAGKLPNLPACRPGAKVFAGCCAIAELEQRKLRR